MNLLAPLRRHLATRRARSLIREGAAVILDTETTDFDGDIIEVAVVAADTGRILFDTLIQPTKPIAVQAHAVHGITEQMCAQAPTWAQVLPQLDVVIAGRTVLAYNAPYDQARINANCAAINQPAPLWRWECLMRMDAQARGTRRWRKLEGGHRALGDVLAARQRLVSIGKVS
ncbi:exonuclease, DNA polymerase III subunit epsilon family [Mycobacteroides abscessus subsp. abscessus]|nr:exonuclease, DNA polymerase III subunit epsilon family [Mycobacteroides abscessus subsp. abscessus]